MIKSMTGFSKAHASEHGVSATVEVKSVNGRYLEISAKLPRTHSHKEFELRESVKKQIVRGTVNVFVSLEKTAAAGAQSAIDEQAALQLFDSLTSLKKKLKIKDAVKLEHLLPFSQHFMASDNSDMGELEWKIIFKALLAALRDLDKMRQNEGRELSRDIHNRIKAVEKHLNNVEERAARRIPDERERLRLRISQLFDSDEIDEQRLQMEIVMLADKLDVSEECVRLRSHIKFFYETMKNSDAGRKLNFLLQEMHREVNTIGSKANDADIAHIVVQMKEELEKMREQVQNIE